MCCTFIPVRFNWFNHRLIIFTRRKKFCRTPSWRLCHTTRCLHVSWAGWFIISTFGVRLFPNHKVTFTSWRLDWSYPRWKKKWKYLNNSQEKPQENFPSICYICHLDENQILISTYPPLTLLYSSRPTLILFAMLVFPCDWTE